MTGRTWTHAAPCPICSGRRVAAPRPADAAGAPDPGGAALPPVIIVVVLGSTAAGGEQWQLIGVAIPVALGLMRYLTTSFRISGGRIELKRGLLNRHVLSTPVDRVRTVDLTSSPIHRLLGLTKVRIGTGTASTSDEDRIDLDGLPLERARALRTELLQTSTADDEAAAEPAPEREVVTFDPAWVRFAPLTGSGVVIGAAALGAGSQLLQSVGFWERFDPDNVDVPGVPLAVLVPLLVLGVLVVISLLSIGGYVVTNWGFRLTRSRGAATWHLTRGLFTTRETTLDDDRLAGVNLSEPLGLRLARGARLSAIVTGLSRSQQGSSTLVPPAPRQVVERVAREVLDTALPVETPLVAHGPRAARRRWTRALLPALVIAVAASWRSLARRPAVAAGRPGRAPRRGPARLGPHPLPRPRPRRGPPRRPVRLRGPPPPDPGGRPRHRVEPARHLVPAPRRPHHAGRHHGGRQPVRPGARRTRARGGPRRPRGAAGPGGAVPELTERSVEPEFSCLICRTTLWARRTSPAQPRRFSTSPTWPLFGSRWEHLSVAEPGRRRSCWAIARVPGSGRGCDPRAGVPQAAIELDEESPVLVLDVPPHRTIAQPG